MTLETISPLRQRVDKELDVKSMVLAQFYNEAIKHGMDQKDAREAFLSVMTAEADKYLSDIMVDVPTFTIKIDQDKEKKAQRIIDSILYGPICDWEHIIDVASKETENK